MPRTKIEAENEFKALLSNLNLLLSNSNINANTPTTKHYGYNSYAFGYRDDTVSASIQYRDFITTENFGKLVPYLMAIGSSVVSNEVKLPEKLEPIELELLDTSTLLNKVRASNSRLNDANDSVGCRNQCFGSCMSNCLQTCKGSCATTQ